MRQQQPFFSIIVPTYNRPRQLATCLQSLARLDYRRDRFEVIVVDDGSTVLPEAMIASFHTQVDLTLLQQPHAGPAGARNTGAAKARGLFLAFTDDDCQPAPDWLTTLAVRFAAMPHCALGGRTINTLPQNRYSTCSQLLIDYLYSYYNAIAKQSRFFTSNNLALPTDRFVAMGGFDTRFTRAGAEDRELCDRWLHHGYRMVYVSEAMVYHISALTFRTFWRQHFNYGRGAFYFHETRAQRGHSRIMLEPLRFYLDLLRYPSSQGQNGQTLQLATLLVLAQLANATGFFWERGLNRKNSRKCALGGHQPRLSASLESRKVATRCDELDVHVKALKTQSFNGDANGWTQECFIQQLRSVASAVDEFIDAVLQGEPKELYLASSHYIKSGGKRLRPFLLIKSCELLGGSLERALPVAAAVEMIHNFTLVHDDIIDNDEFRHDVPTVHRQYGLPLAILAGDTLIVKAFQCITTHGGKAGLPDDVIVELIAKLTSSCLDMSEGEALDVDMTSNGKFSSGSQYIEIIAKKTGALFQTSCELGALCAQTNEGDIDNLARFGRNLGIAFQLIDDLLGAVGDSRVTKKPLGNDLREGKKTLPILLAIGKAKGHDREKIVRVFGTKNGSDTELKEALSVLTGIDVDCEVRNTARLYAMKAMDSIKAYKDSNPKKALQSLADFVVERAL